MLLSAVIHLKALEKANLPQHLGSAIRAEFLGWVQGVDQQAAHDLHAGDDLRPYTISDLHGTFKAQDGYYQVQKGESAWFRVTCLRARESMLLLNTLLPRLKGRKFSLQGGKFEVGEEAVVGGHPWAKVESAQVLYERYFEGEREAPDGLEIEFSAPTSFAVRNTQSDLPLPIPELVFDSWLRRWNKFAGVALPRKAVSMREAKLALSQYEDLKTHPVQLPDELLVGFTGKCRFRVLAKKDAYWTRLCNLLADFSFYCGTGAKTAVGLGQTKRL